MTNKELQTLTGNKTIIDFMGVKPKSVISDIYYWNDAPFFYVSETTPEKVIDAIVKYVKYSTSWDWLMPVVEKCLIGEAENGYNYKPLYDALCSIDLYNTFLEVINYIYWFNSKE